MDVVTFLGPSNACPKFDKKEVQNWGIWGHSIESAIESLSMTSYLRFNRLCAADQIALPEFNSGAMENWGIITYRESSLLYNPVTSSTAEKQRVCAVIAHEIAHQVRNFLSASFAALDIGGHHLTDDNCPKFQN